MPGRLAKGYYEVDLISDILSRGNSSRLHRTLVKDKQLFSEIHAYNMGSFDIGMFVIEGKPLENVSTEAAEAAIWEQLELLKQQAIPADELTKVKNKTESTMVFSEMSLLDKAMNLAQLELLGDAGDRNHDTDEDRAVTAEQIQKQANAIFRKENSSTLIYLAEKN